MVILIFLGYFGRWFEFINCFGVYLYSWTTLIFYDSFNADFLIWLNLGVILFTFWSPSGLSLGSRLDQKKCFVVYSCSWSTFIFYVSFNSDIWFWFNFGSFFTFWDSNGLFLGSMWGSKTVFESTHVVEQLSFSLIPWILTFEFDLIFGSFFCHFWALMWSFFTLYIYIYIY